MKIERSRTHRINLGKGTYEYVEIGARVSIEVDAIDSETTIKDLNSLLDQALEEDMTEAIANVPQGESTHAETWRNE